MPCVPYSIRYARGPIGERSNFGSVTQMPKREGDGACSSGRKSRLTPSASAARWIVDRSVGEVRAATRPVPDLDVRGAQRGDRHFEHPRGDGTQRLDLTDTQAGRVLERRSPWSLAAVKGVLELPRQIDPTHRVPLRKALPPTRDGC